MMRVDSVLGAFLKRSSDLLGAGIGLLLLLPLLLLIAGAIKVEDGGPVFFRQVRVGRGGVVFRIWKFRTMSEGADSQGNGITMKGDVRVTRVGRLLRRTKLDELPQLLNVFRGEMSLVGPRPEIPRFVADYSAKERAVLSVRPGMTDPASLQYMDEESLVAEAADPLKFYRTIVLPDKIARNIAYQREATLGSDLRIIFNTLRAVSRRSR